MATLKPKKDAPQGYLRGLPLNHIHPITPPVVLINESSNFKLFSWPELPLPSVKVGIEVEVENIRKGISFESYWSAKEDGSLRNHGMEYVSIPINGKHIPYALTGLFAGLKATNPRYHFSPRTSIHIHLDMTEYGSHDLANLTLIYTVVESFLFKYAGKDRDKSVFCVPYATTHFGSQFFTTLASNGWYQGLSKYMALNMTRLRDLGTIEFRHLPGTDDVKKIVTWICLIQHILKKALTVDHKELISKITELNTNSEYFMFLSWVFEDAIQHLDLSSHREDMEHGVKCVKLFSSQTPVRFLMLAEGSPLYEKVKKEMPKERKYTYDDFVAGEVSTFSNTSAWGMATLSNAPTVLTAQPEQDLVEAELGPDSDFNEEEMF